MKESAKKVKARLGFPFILFVSRWAQAFIIFGMCKLIRVHSMQHNAGDLFCGFDIMHGILMQTVACWVSAQAVAIPRIIYKSCIRGKLHEKPQFNQYTFLECDVRAFNAYIHV